MSKVGINISSKEFTARNKLAASYKLKANFRFQLIEDC